MSGFSAALKIIAGSFATLSVGMGIPTHCLIISYLVTKPSLYKTAFDFIMIDTVLSLIVFILSTYSVVMVGLCMNIVPYTVNVFLSYIMYLSTHFFFISCIVSVLTKHFFIRHPDLMWGTSDTKLRKESFGIKILFLVVLVAIDQFGPIQANVMPFQFLSYDIDIER